MVYRTESPTAENAQVLVDQLVALSRQYGADPAFVLAGGGNTSVKLGERLLVKGSGWALATIGPEGFVDMDRAALQGLLDSTLSADRMEREAEFKAAVLAARREPEKGQRPSVETVLHHLIPGRFVVHTHATLINAFSCAQEGRRLIEDALGEDVLWIPCVDPGFLLAKTLERALAAYRARTGRAHPRAIVLQNHGLVVAGETPEEIDTQTQWLRQGLEEILARHRDGTPFGTPGESISGVAARTLINRIGPALRGLLASGSQALKVVCFDDAPILQSLVTGSDGRAIATAGPLTPDQIVYCKSFPLWFEADPDEPEAPLIQRLSDAVEDYRARYQLPPNVVLVKGLGLFAAGDAWSDAETVRLVYTDAVTVMAGAQRLGGVSYLPDDLRRFIEEWEVESYRKGIAAAKLGAGRVAGKVALVTGASQGFGLAIARDLAGQGAHVVLADINPAGAQTAAGELCAQLGAGRAMALAVDVSNSASVASALHQVVRTYGGLDVLVSNAGILRAGSVKTQAERDFDLSTAVNYKGYFLCVQHTAPIMAIQHRICPERWSDIIQINSKSGLEGSNKNFAYAGSKFGGIGLTQSFALELVEDGVKVNSICPGNFFEGPLWSDPVTGLFAQYLAAGKVPGARSVEDVKRFYESKVPMGRGCTAADVLRAIYYLIEQQYETGQALPVTGGQVMLH
jgi:rhamnose utilization protein RhaD (predicted bifunctional aldolase and dehydrogenase)/NAD(P)-dependent dehydrogenase (short-subunit alcohol dehydrogenase family)